MNANDLLEMFPGEIESRLQAGNDIAILPIGSLEQHGPHLLLATDSFCAQALAQEIGNCSGGTVLPPIPYSWVGCTNVFAGGIGVRESVFIDYLRAVVKRLWQSGFRRILVVNSHGGNSCALRVFPTTCSKRKEFPYSASMATRDPRKRKTSYGRREVRSRAARRVRCDCWDVRTWWRKSKRTLAVQWPSLVTGRQWS